MRIMGQSFLYHYTSIESLALILKNKTIRFSPLNKMDDLQEAESSDVHNIGQIIYVSSWTSDDEESIPMWNMYTSLTSGIRIKMPVKPFKVYENRAEDLSKALSSPVNDNTEGNPFLSVIPLTEMIQKKFVCLEAFNKDFLYKVQYTSDQEKLLPHIKNVTGDQLSIATGSIGKYKNIKWNFQKEWRYRITLFPFDFKQSVDLMNQSFNLMANRLAHGLDVQPLPYYDMKLDDNAFESMEITTSPKISDGNNTILMALTDKYNPKAIIKRSSLVGMI